jgi:hypothetical protein
MSELSELRRVVGEIHTTAIQTARDVTWIKQGMDAGNTRMDSHAKRIGRIERRQHWYSGFAAALGTLLGAGGSHIIR